MATRHTLEDVRIHMDPNLKQQADELFAQMGLDFSTACNIFVRQSLLEDSIPFDFTLRFGDNTGMASAESVRS